jgi:uncharacterized membrane protein
MKLRTLGPYLLLLVPAVALVLFADQFPDPMPVHWGASGRPNGFLPRTPLALALPVLLMGGILLFIDAVVAGGARVGPPEMTEGVHRLLAPIRWMLALLAAPAAFAPLTGPTPVLVGAVLMVLVIGVQIVRSPRFAPPGPDGARRGVIYMNPADPRLIVPKTWGVGWTFNFARPIAWVILGLLLLGPLALAGGLLIAAGAHH